MSQIAPLFLCPTSHASIIIARSCHRLWTCTSSREDDTLVHKSLQGLNEGFVKDINYMSSW